MHRTVTASREPRRKKLGGPPLLRRLVVSPVDVSSIHPIKCPSKLKGEKGLGEREKSDPAETSKYVELCFEKILIEHMVRLKFTRSGVETTIRNV